eukprot:4373354-Pleurochrysis_carterae.AAC.3
MGREGQSRVLALLMEGRPKWGRSEEELSLPGTFIGGRKEKVRLNWSGSVNEEREGEASTS